MSYKRKDFLGLKDISADEIHNILKTADTMKYLLAKKNKRSPHLQGKTIVMLFYEKSSRTRLSYQLAAQYLSATIVDMDTQKESIRGETVYDIGAMTEQMGADYIILRHPTAGTAKLLSKTVNASVINAGDGRNENPTQALLDLMTIKERKGEFAGLNVTLIGDVMHSRVAKSDMWALLKLGAKVKVAAPPTLIPPGLEDFGIEVFYDAAEAIKDADVVLSVRTYAEGHNRSFLPSLDEYKSFFRINSKLLKQAKPGAIVMYPGYINRGIEISSTVIESEQCVINDQVLNGVAVRMAILYMLSLREADKNEL